jgi:hypothetical protein
MFYFFPPFYATCIMASAFQIFFYMKIKVLWCKRLAENLLYNAEIFSYYFSIVSSYITKCNSLYLTQVSLKLFLYALIFCCFVFVAVIFFLWLNSGLHSC